jgi:predicted kinase
MIILNVGMIASGKTSYCKEKAKEGYLCVSGDDITMMLHAGNYDLYDIGLKDTYREIERSIIYSAISAGKSIIVDKVNMSIRSRRKYVEYAQELNVPICVHHTQIETPEIHATRRYHFDHRGYSLQEWKKIAERHLSEYERPTHSEGFSWILFKHGTEEV